MNLEKKKKGKFGKNNLGEKRKKGEIKIRETGKNVI